MKYLNFKKVKTFYPKVCKKLDSEWKLSTMSNINATQYLHFRDLYDFFDKHGIYISVKMNVYMTFEFSIMTDPDISFLYNSMFEYSERTQAEDDAFIKAFELLESILKD